MDIKHNKNGMGGWTVITLAMALQSDRIHELCSNGVQKKRENFFFSSSSSSSSSRATTWATHYMTTSSKTHKNA